MQSQTASQNPSAAVNSDRAKRLSPWVNGALIISLILCALVLVQRAWLSDDAFITFRTVDNFLNGYGLVWNVGERVQAYTHPLWMFLLSGASFVTGELVFTSIILSILISITAVILLVTKIARTNLTAIFLVVVLTLSNAFIDFSTSGLENPLSHLLLVIFFAIFFIQKPSVRKVFWLSLIASLGALNRLDLYLIFGPAILFALYQAFSFEAVLALILGQLPLFAWELFSIFYYGFPFPNTAYAKLNTGIPALELLRQGWLYLKDSMNMDPLTLVTIASAVVLAFLGREKRNIPIGLGIVLYLIYVLKIGGDFMSGRFLAAPFLCGLIILARFDLNTVPRLAVGLLFAVVISLGLLSPTPTLNFAEADLTNKQRLSMVIDHKIANERRYYRWSTGLFRINPKTGIPNHPFAEGGLQARQERPRLARRITVGMFGYYAGPEIYVVDELALTDAFLARLPARRVDQWRIGHFQRTIPAGYLDTLRKGSNQLLDTKLAELYDHLSLITRGNLWSKDRLKVIWQLNTRGVSGLVDFDNYRYPKMVSVGLSEVDHNFPDGVPWNTPGAVIFTDSGIQVNLDEPSFIPKIKIGLDASNAYQIEFLRDGKVIADQKIPQISKKAIITGVCLTVAEKAVRDGFNAIRIFSIQGDPDYSLGYLVLGECPNR